MPRGDYSGPRGMGPKTGRGMGYCASNEAPGFMFSRPRLGQRRRRGFGRGIGMGRALGRPQERNRGVEGEIAKRIEELEKQEEQKET